MENENNKKTNERAIILFSVFILLLIGAIITPSLQWKGSLTSHSLVEVISTLLALFVGLMAMVRYYSRKENLIFFIGAGFIGTAFLDAFHGLIAHFALTQSAPDSIIFRFPWSWLAPRMYLSITLFISMIFLLNKSYKDTPLKEKLYLTIAIFSTVLVFLFFAYTPIVPELYSLLGFARPLELIPAFLFGGALFGFLYRHEWDNNTIEFCLAISLIINFAVQCFYIPFSAETFDAISSISHLLKMASYLVILVALLFDLNRIYRQAELANRTKSEFLNMMSHELRTPLTIILGYSPILAHPERLPSTKKLLEALEQKSGDMDYISRLVENCFSELKKYVGKMDNSGKRLLTLIGDLLDFSRLEAGMMTISPSNISLKQVAQNAIRHHSYKLNDKGLTLTSNFVDSDVYADEEKLLEIFDKLLSNAIKFTEQGIIDISTKEVGPFIEISISDTGCGIDLDAKGHIFNWFTQVDSTSTRYIGGIGLGLAITKKLVELHGGTITVSSTPGNGTTFTLTVPKG
ncbi:ATP-binding protein [Pseudemcibacter aquimaris]|uniref:sensor histidine kinase n=1 Tax=Pseudemcibacter aquimaris TaxID=2857064 RepID=UPI002010F1D5|nr:ATP-binding protein [Pseudemcibacter aquimaris]MCC3861040.1 hypothetical protein [Pseudemcibacter aquimaris]WDU59857.1 hypothetical protein KW060_06260 [Pseudemcibacter aquimaris]